MKQYFGNNIKDILESVHSIVSDTTYIKNERAYWKKIDMAQNRDTEKIIVDAEKTLGKTNPEDTKLNISLNETLVLKNEKTDNNNDVLILTNEYKVDNEENIVSNNLLEDGINLEDLEEENKIQELENNFLYITKKLKSSNTRQEEKIKDLNILLDKFASKERYTDLDKKIKLYQDDNAALRKKILNLSESETHLRSQLSEINQGKQIEENKIKTFEESARTEKEEIEKLNTKIENLSQKNNQLQSELLSLKKDKEYQSSDVNQKVNFYREEYAKIIVDKSDIQKKLEISKSQLIVNEKNKVELKKAIENLNQILSSSNIETRAFSNESEELVNKPRKEK